MTFVKKILLLQMQQCCINAYICEKLSDMKTLKPYYLMMLAISICLLASCKKDDPDDVIEEEVITTVNYTLTSPDGDVVTLTWLDIDGEGANEPVITGGEIKAGVLYTGSMELLNESEMPSEDITEEIKEEDDEHQFFFSSGGGLTVSYTDMDGDGNPVGLSTTLIATEGSYDLNVKLIHEPAKDADGVSEGNISNAGGSADVDVTFPINATM